MTLKADVVLITPEVASEWLKGNVGNFRGVDNARVRRYAKDMSSGRWDATGDTIKFTGDNLVADGQHRLLACVESGAAFTSLVVWGASGVANIDRGRPRRVGQWLAHIGFKNSNNIASLARTCVMHEKGLWKNRSWGAAEATDSEVIDFAKKNHDGLQSAHRLAVKCKIIVSSMFGSILFLGSSEDIPEEDGTVRWFAESMAYGRDISETDAVYHLRNRCITEKSGTTKSSPHMMRMIATKAWNKTVRGESCRSAASIRVTLTGPAKEKPIVRVLKSNEYCGADNEQ